jgi:thiol-disulfide isomerase/thioredoxin
MKEVNSETNRSIIESHPFVVVKFGMPGCAPCKTVSKAIESLSPKFPQVEFLDVDAIIDFDFAAEMQVRSVPAIFFAVNGEYLKDNKGNNLKVIDAKSMEAILHKMLE